MKIQPEVHGHEELAREVLAPDPRLARKFLTAEGLPSPDYEPMLALSAGPRIPQGILKSNKDYTPPRVSY